MRSIISKFYFSIFLFLIIILFIAISSAQPDVSFGSNITIVGNSTNASTTTSGGTSDGDAVGDGGTSDGDGGGGGGGSCDYNWNCTDWEPFICPESGVRTRACTNEGTCIGIFGKPEETQACTPESEFSPEIPERLLDIELELEDDIIYTGDLTGLIGLENIATKLKVIIFFDNFGDSPLPVDLTYIILNEFGEEVYNEIESITIFNNAIINKEFDNLNLASGKYRFISKIKYGDGLVEEFEQEFEIKESIIPENILYSLIGIFVLIIVLIIWFILRRKGRKEKRMRKKRK